MVRNHLTYDPSDREPATFGELVIFAAHWAAFPRSPSGTCPPVHAHNPDHHFLESYCRDEFGSCGLDALAKVRARYLVATRKTIDQIDATTLKEMADHFFSGSHHSVTELSSEQPRPEVPAGPTAEQAALMERLKSLALNRIDIRITKLSRMIACEMEGTGENRNHRQWTRMKDLSIMNFLSDTFLARRECQSAGIRFETYSPILDSAVTLYDELFAFTSSHPQADIQKLNEGVDYVVAPPLGFDGVCNRHANERFTALNHRVHEVINELVKYESAVLGTIQLPTSTRKLADPNRPSEDRQDDIITVIRNARTPLTRPEIVEALKMDGEGKLGKNLTWMFNHKLLVKVPRRGYWLASEPLPE